MVHRNLWWQRMLLDRDLSLSLHLDTTGNQPQWSQRWPIKIAKPRTEIIHQSTTYTTCWLYHLLVNHDTVVSWYQLYYIVAAALLVLPISYHPITWGSHVGIAAPLSCALQRFQGVVILQRPILSRAACCLGWSWCCGFRDAWNRCISRGSFFGGVSTPLKHIGQSANHLDTGENQWYSEPATSYAVSLKLLNWLFSTEIIPEFNRTGFFHAENLVNSCWWMISTKTHLWIWTATTLSSKLGNHLTTVVSAIKPSDIQWESRSVWILFASFGYIILWKKWWSTARHFLIKVQYDM